MNIHGATADERKEARRKRTAQRRAEYYRGLLREAASPSDQFRHACDYLRAIANDRPPDAVAAMTRKLLEFADEESKK